MSVYRSGHARPEGFIQFRRWRRQLVNQLGGRLCSRLTPHRSQTFYGDSRAVMTGSTAARIPPSARGVRCIQWGIRSLCQSSETTGGVMYRHLFVPLDGTDLSVETVGQAVEYASTLGARITFFH